jgi:glutamyl-Q tRNA(Asp) synthetase
MPAILALAQPFEPMSPVSIFRFAPTPNGPLHLGHAYSALLNAKLAAAAGGQLLLRIEDLDPTRCKREFETAIETDLDWLGVAFTGPRRRQSEHADDYARALDGLRARALAYPCFCSRSMVAAASQGRDPDGAPLYAGTCRGLSRQEIAARLAAGERAIWRLDSAGALALLPAALDWREWGEGERETLQPADPALWGDFALRGRDSAASYHLAVVVDDALQGVSDVVRGRDLFAATSAHRLLQVLLDLPAPRYRHHRLALDADGVKLAKSASATPLSALRGEGVSAEAVCGALGFALGGRKDRGAPPFVVRLN